MKERKVYPMKGKVSGRHISATIEVAWQYATIALFVKHRVGQCIKCKASLPCTVLDYKDYSKIVFVVKQEDYSNPMDAMQDCFNSLNEIWSYIDFRNAPAEWICKELQAILM
jgi:hypothetical protein